MNQRPTLQALADEHLATRSGPWESYRWILIDTAGRCFEEELRVDYSAKLSKTLLIEDLRELADLALFYAMQQRGTAPS